MLRHHLWNIHLPKLRDYRYVPPFRYEKSTELVPLCIRNTSCTQFGQNYYVDSNVLRPSQRF